MLYVEDIVYKGNYIKFFINLYKSNNREIDFLIY